MQKKQLITRKPAYHHGQLLLEDDFIAEQQLTVVVGGLARNQLLFLHDVASLTSGQRFSRVTCRPRSLPANGLFYASRAAACAIPTRRSYGPVWRSR